MVAHLAHLPAAALEGLPEREGWEGGPDGEGVEGPGAAGEAEDSEGVPDSLDSMEAVRATLERLNIPGIRGSFTNKPQHLSRQSRAESGDSGSGSSQGKRSPKTPLDATLRRIRGDSCGTQGSLSREGSGGGTPAAGSSRQSMDRGHAGAAGGRAEPPPPPDGLGADELPDGLQPSKSLFTRHSNLASLMATPERQDAFAAAKEVVDGDLEGFTASLLPKLQTSIEGKSPEEGKGTDMAIAVYTQLVETANLCRMMSVEEFKKECRVVVDNLETMRRQVAEKRCRNAVLRLLFILTRCSRMLNIDEAAQESIYGTRMLVKRRTRLGSLPNIMTPSQLQRSVTTPERDFNAVLATLKFSPTSTTDGETTPEARPPPTPGARGLKAPMTEGKPRSRGWIKPPSLRNLGKMIVGLKKWRRTASDKAQNVRFADEAEADDATVDRLSSFSEGMRGANFRSSPRTSISVEEEERDLDLLCKTCAEVVRMEDLVEHSKTCGGKKRTPDERLAKLAQGLEARLPTFVVGVDKYAAQNLIELARKVCALQPDGTAGPAAKGRALFDSMKLEQEDGTAKLEEWTERMIEVVQEKLHWLSAPSGAEGAAAQVEDGSRVDIKDFEIIKQISQGAYGKVMLAKKKKTGDHFAIKVMRKLDLVRKNAVEMVANEKNILATSDNPFVVRFFYSFTSEENLYLVMEYVPGGDCYSLLRAMGCIDEAVAKMYVAETVLALEYCHTHGVVHRDLKPDNLLISGDGHIKLTDFGLSSWGLTDRAETLSSQFGRVASSSFDSPMKGARLASQRGAATDSGESEVGSGVSVISATGSVRGLGDAGAAPRRKRKWRRKVVGTPDYLAPELLLGTFHGPEADWWSLGAILYEFVIGVPPFNAETPSDIFRNILDRRIEWPGEDELSPECRDLIEKLLALDPEDRLGHRGASEIKMHPFFADVEWNSLTLKKAAFIPRPENIEDTSYFIQRPTAQATGKSSVMSVAVPDGQDRADLGNVSPVPASSAIAIAAPAGGGAPARAAAGLLGSDCSIDRPLSEDEDLESDQFSPTGEIISPSAVDWRQFSFKNLPMIAKAQVERGVEEGAPGR